MSSGNHADDGDAETVKGNHGILVVVLEWLDCCSDCFDFDYHDIY